MLKKEVRKIVPKRNSSKNKKSKNKKVFTSKITSKYSIRTRNPLFFVVFLVLILILLSYIFYNLYNNNPESFIGRAFESPQKFAGAQTKPILQQEIIKQGATINYYVAVNGNDNNPGTLGKPFATLEGARNAVRKLKFNSADGNLHNQVNIIVRKGTYILKKPFVLEGIDSGAEDAQINYMAYPNEKAIITGGIKVTTPWKVYDLTKGIYATDIRSIIPQDAENFGFNSLFVNGERAIRARTPNEGAYYSFFYFFEQPELQEPCARTTTGICTPFTAFVFNSSGANVADLRASWRNLNDAEIVFQLPFTQPRFRIQGIDEERKVVFFDSLEAYRSGAFPPIEDNGNGFYYYFRAPMSRYYVENVLEALDSEGEWYFDKNTYTLYYKPKSGEDLSNPAREIIIPYLNQLVQMQKEMDEMELNGSFTLTHWIKTQNQNIYTISNTGSYNGYSFGLSRGKIRLLIGQLNNNDGNEEGEEEYINAVCDLPDGVNINDGEWHMISGVVRRDNNILNIPENNKKFICYVDGEKAGEAQLDDSYPNMQMRKPVINPFPCAECNVSVDELKIYSRELDGNEIKHLFNNEVISSDDLMLSLSFEDNLKDDSGSFNILKKNDGNNPEFEDGIAGKRALLFGNRAVEDAIKYPLNTVKNIHINGFKFMFTDWNLPDGGYVSGQAGINIQDNPAVNFYIAEDVSFENNYVAHVGGYGLDVYGKNVKIKNNELYDLGAGGIKIGHQSNNALIGGGRYITYEGGDNEILDNTIHGIGKVYPEGVGIWSLLSGGNKISHNEIYDATYSGMSVGWNWGVGDTQAKNNIITYNNIHGVMKVLSDGAGIYTLGKQPGTVISNNFIHDYSYDSQKHINLVAGIYMDEGSSDIEVKNNIAYNAGATSLVMGYGFNRIVDNNIFIDNQNSRDVWHGQLYLHNCRPNDSCTASNIFNHNIIYSSDSGWKLLTVSPLFSQEVFSKNVIFNSQKELNSSVLLNVSCPDCVIANPLFKGGNNFMLSTTSPAFDKSIGFKQFDLMKDVKLAGPRQMQNKKSEEVIDTRLAKLNLYRR